MAEQVSQEFEDEMEGKTPTLIELFDIFLSDGTHLRYCSDSQDGQYMDFEE